MREWIRSFQHSDWPWTCSSAGVHHSTQPNCQNKCWWCTFCGIAWICWNWHYHKVQYTVLMIRVRKRFFFLLKIPSLAPQTQLKNVQSCPSKYPVEWCLQMLKQYQLWFWFVAFVSQNGSQIWQVLTIKPYFFIAVDTIYYNQCHTNTAKNPTNWKHPYCRPGTQQCAAEA